MINRVYKAELEKKAMELKALQAMINPHFLYNCLSSIKWKAIRTGNDEISDLTGHLAKFYRTSLNGGKQITTVGSELENVKSYVELQRMTHENSFDVEYELDETLFETSMPNFLLQPIVENAIFHGLETKPDKGKVTIRVEMTEKNVIIIVSDDGVGIGREELELMRDSLKNSKKETDKECKSPGERGNGIALANVSQRIKLIFGDDYGLNLYSTKGIGTDVEIILPIMTDKSLL